MKFNAIIKKVIIWIILGIIFSLLSHYVIELLYYNYNIDHVKNLIFEVRPELFLLGSLVLFTIYSFFTFLSGSPTVGGILLLLLSWAFGLATQYKNEFRAEPLYANELSMIKEIPFLFEMIGTRKSVMILSVVIVTIVLLILIYHYIIKPRKTQLKSKSYFIFRGVGVLISFLCIVYISRFNYPSNKVKDVYDNHASWVTYNQGKNYSDNGFIAGFLSNLNAPSMHKPSNYSKKSIEEIVEKYSDVSNGINENRDNKMTDTNLIFVMNESFSDPFNIEGIESDKDPLPYYREIVEESLNGKLLAPSLGGGTATNEFQVLTGFSLEPFEAHVTSPYVQLTSQIGDFPSVIGKMKNIGYKTTAIHPYTPTFYRRNDVYLNFGFDEFRHQENVKHTETISPKHRYISDFAAYQEVFDVIETSKERDFIHLVTIQNHMPYANKYERVNYDVSGTGNDEEANAYFTDLENSDLSLKLLINKIDSYEEPILLVFWGDHLPGFYDEGIFKQNGPLTMYETPFFVYSNEMDLEGEVGLISPIYLKNYTSKVMNTKITPYEALLLELENHIPIIREGLYYDKNHQEFVYLRDDLSKEAQEVLEDYTMLMYDITTGNQYASQFGLFKYNE